MKLWIFFCFNVELLQLGFISLLLTVGENPIANICIPKSTGETFLPCSDPSNDSPEEAKCEEQVDSTMGSIKCLSDICFWILFDSLWMMFLEQGMVSLLSRQGMKELQYLIFVLAFFHSLSCILTFGLGMAKVIHFFNAKNSLSLSLWSFDSFLSIILGQQSGVYVVQFWLLCVKPSQTFPWKRSLRFHGMWIWRRGQVWKCGLCFTFLVLFYWLIWQMRKWESWEAETRTSEYRFSNGKLFVDFGIRLCWPFPFNI